ncbi:MAG: MFS transporter [Micrococcales bacterium]|nr:MFS transporter [Micrococcales bacterium]
MRVIRDLGALLRTSGFRRLFTVRVVSQAGDGVFQVGLATLFFFSPERMTTAGGVAGAFAVLLLPFTVVGPFAGPLLDRWRRRQVLLVANLVRMVLTGALAAVIATAGVNLAVYGLALVILGVNRFLLSALSAGQPLVVPGPLLLTANSLTPTLGAVAAVTGAAVGFVAGRLLPAGAARDGGTLAAAAVVFGVAAALALRLGADQLGPERAGRLPAPGARWRALGADLRVAVLATGADLAAAARYLVARRTPGAAIGVMGAQRFVYGVNFLALILLSRNLLSDPADADAGLRTFGLLLAVSFVGNGLAVLVTPVAHIDPARWVTGCLGVGALSQAALATGPSWPVVVASAVLLGVSIQGTKIAVDTIVQRDTHDVFRGRAFALYDVTFNAAFVAAAALSALVLPDTGWAAPTFVGLAVGYAVLAVAYGRVRREPDHSVGPAGPTGRADPTDDADRQHRAPRPPGRGGPAR